MKESERLVIQRKQHSKLCFSSQQGKPLTVEKLKTLYLSLTFHWQPDEGRWSGISFRNQDCNNGQGSARGGTNIFLEYIFEFLISPAPLVSDTVYQQNFKAKNLRYYNFSPVLFFITIFLTCCLVSICLYCCPFTPSQCVAINVFLRTRSPKTTAKLIQNNVYCFFITLFRLAIPAFFRFTDVTEFM